MQLQRLIQADTDTDATAAADIVAGTDTAIDTDTGADTDTCWAEPDIQENRHLL